MAEVREQLRNMRDEIKNLSGRLEKIEALIPSAKEPEKVTMRLGDALMLGDRDAKLGIVEFSDYQCPFCRRFHTDTFPQLQENYIDAGKVALIVKNFPLDFHPAAMNAALAVTCAGVQDVKRFWDVQGDLFDNQKRLGADLYMELIKKYGLDQQKFDACMSDGARKKKVQEDLKYAQSLGVQGTPTFFIGYIEGDQLVDAMPLVGAQTYSVFAQVIESMSKQQGKGS